MSTLTKPEFIRGFSDDDGDEKDDDNDNDNDIINDSANESNRFKCIGSAKFGMRMESNSSVICYRWKQMIESEMHCFGS